MAFSFDYLARSSTSGNIDAGKVWIYNGTSTGSNETVATIVGSGYFNNAQVVLTNPFGSGSEATTGTFAVNDVIQVNGNNASGFYIVTSVTTNVTLASYSTIGAIGTANIDDLAVTTAKIDDLAVTTGKLAAAAVTSAKLDPSTIQYATVTLSSAEILALRATPKTLVAAPAAGYVHQFLGAMLILNATATAYVETDDNLAIKYTNGSGVAVSQTIEATGFIDQTADTMTDAIPALNAIVAATGATAQALVLHNTGSGEYTTGTGTMNVMVAYRTFATGL